MNQQDIIVLKLQSKSNRYDSILRINRPPNYAKEPFFVAIIITIMKNINNNKNERHSTAGQHNATRVLTSNKVHGPLDRHNNGRSAYLFIIMRISHDRMPRKAPEFHGTRTFLFVKYKSRSVRFGELSPRAWPMIPLNDGSAKFAIFTTFWLIQPPKNLPKLSTMIISINFEKKNLNYSIFYITFIGSNQAYI